MKEGSVTAKYQGWMIRIIFLFR